MLIIVPTAGEAKALFDGAVPSGETPVETRVGDATVRAALCGFGPAAAGVLASIALARAAPSRCLLVGICGTFDEAILPVGGLFEASEVRMDGIGRGEGADHVGPQAMGFAQVPADGSHARVVDRLPVGSGEGGVLLTVATAAARPAEALRRRERHPDARAEDMEGFPVALACARLGVPLTILRGASNVVGAEAAWDREAGLAAAREGLEAFLAAEASK